MSKVLAWTALAAALLSPAASFAASATYPDRPIRFIVPLAPGGAVDLAARAIAQELSASRFAAQGAEAVGSTSAEFAAHIRREIDKWGKVVRAAKLTVN